MTDRRLIWTIGLGLAAYLAMLGLIVTGALASAVPERPDPASAAGCEVVLPPAGQADPRPFLLSQYGSRALSMCEPISLPVSFGASLRDRETGHPR